MGVVIVSDAYGFHFGQPWWLLASTLIVPMVWLARRNLASLGRVRYAMALALRVMVILLLVILLARPMLVRKSRRATVIAVMDRSRSIPEASAEEAATEDAVIEEPEAEEPVEELVEVTEAEEIE